MHAAEASTQGWVGGQEYYLSWAAPANLGGAVHQPVNVAGRVAVHPILRPCTDPATPALVQLGQHCVDHGGEVDDLQDWGHVFSLCNVEAHHPVQRRALILAPPTLLEDEL